MKSYAHLTTTQRRLPRNRHMVCVLHWIVYLKNGPIYSIPFRITSLALWQSCDYPATSEASPEDEMKRSRIKTFDRNKLKQNIIPLHTHQMWYDYLVLLCAKNKLVKSISPATTTHHHHYHHPTPTHQIRIRIRKRLFGMLKMRRQWLCKEALFCKCKISQDWMQQI